MYMFERIIFSKLNFNNRKTNCETTTQGKTKLLSEVVCEKKVKNFIFMQGELVHRLKEQGASESELSKAVGELKARKKILETKVRVLQLLVYLFLIFYQNISAAS